MNNNAKNIPHHPLTQKTLSNYIWCIVVWCVDVEERADKLYKFSKQ